MKENTGTENETEDTADENNERKLRERKTNPGKYAKMLKGKNRAQKPVNISRDQPGKIRQQTNNAKPRTTTTQSPTWKAKTKPWKTT